MNQKIYHRPDIASSPNGLIDCSPAISIWNHKAMGDGAMMFAPFYRDGSHFYEIVLPEDARRRFVHVYLILTLKKRGHYGDNLAQWVTVNWFGYSS